MDISKKNTPRWHRVTLNYPGVMIALWVTLCIWLLSMQGGLALPTGWLYDRYSQIAFELDEHEPQVLLVHARLESVSERSEYWLDLLKRIEALEPAQVGFLFVPYLADESFFKQAAAFGNVHLAIGRGTAVDDENTYRWQSVPAELEAAGLTPASRVLAASQRGISRQYATSSAAEGVSYKSLAVAMASADEKFEISTEDSFYINFIKKHQRIPIVSTERVIEQGLIAELVKDKHVIIGVVDDLYETGLTTPLQQNGRTSFSMLEFHGHALDTLLSGQEIDWLDNSFTLIILVVISLTAMVVYQWLNIRQASWLSLVILLLYFVSGWLSMSLFKLNLPVVEMMLAQLLMFLLIFRFIAETEDAALRRMLLSRTNQLHDKSLPASFYSTDEHWAQVITLVNQVLELNRTIFLERIENDHRVREIAALHCSIDDIDEQRRDYQRTPYSTAIEIKAPLKLQRSYLRVADESESEYLVPLIFAGEVLGFWALGVSPEKVAMNEGFVSTVKLFSGEIAEMLYHRQQWRSRQLIEQSHWRRYMQLEAGEVVYKSLNQSLSLFDRYLNSLENVFDGLNSAAILYDLFGRVVQVNQCMEGYLQQAQLPVYDMTALDLMQSVSGIGQSKCRHFLQIVILQQESISLPATLPGLIDRSYVLNVKALQDKQQQSQAQPFQLTGILFELLDVTHMKNMYGLKENLVERLNYQLRNDLAAIMLASELLSNQKISHAKGVDVLKTIRRKVDNAVAVIDEVQQQHDLEVNISGFECYPINVLEAVNNVLAESASTAHQRGVRLEKSIPAVMKLGFADSGQLSTLLAQMLKHLLADAEENSVIRVSLLEGEKEIILNMSSQGFGLPNQLIQDYLFGDAELTSEEFKQLRHAVQSAARWNAKIGVNSEVGRGINFQLILRGFF